MDVPSRGEIANSDGERTVSRLHLEIQQSDEDGNGGGCRMRSPSCARESETWLSNPSQGRYNASRLSYEMLIRDRNP